MKDNEEINLSYKDRLKKLKIKKSKIAELKKNKKLEEKIQSFEDLNFKKNNIQIDQNSSEEDVSKFLKIHLNFSISSIEALGLDGESLFCLEESDIDGEEEITEEEKEKLKNFIITIKKKRIRKRNRNFRK